MAIDPITNFVRGQLTSSVSNSTNTFPVGDASSFPDPSSDGEYNVVVFDAATYDRPSADPAVEIVRVTARDTGADELTVSRAQENTTAEPHPDTTVLHQAVTASVVSQIDDQKLGDGEDFDGQGSSELKNIKSIGVGSHGTVTGLFSQALAYNKALADDGELYDSISSAASNASDVVIIGPGTFSEQVDLSTTDLTLIGSGRGTLIDSPLEAINTAKGTVVRNLAVRNEGTSRSVIRCFSDDCVFQSIWVEASGDHGIRVTGNNAIIYDIRVDSANVSDNDVRLSGDNNLVDDLQGTVNDQGSGNVIGETV